MWIYETTVNYINENTKEEKQEKISISCPDRLTIEEATDLLCEKIPRFENFDISSIEYPEFWEV